MRKLLENARVESWQALSKSEAFRCSECRQSVLVGVRVRLTIPNPCAERADTLILEVCAACMFSEISPLIARTFDALSKEQGR